MPVTFGRPRMHACRFAALGGVVLSGFLVVMTTGAAFAAEGEKAEVRTGDDLADWLDERFADVWRGEGVEPTHCDDAAFVRRAYLDLLGRIPSVAEARDFLGDTHPDRYGRLVDRLLFESDQSKWNDELYAENMARLWRRAMIPTGGESAAMAVRFEPWLVRQFAENVGFDELARRLVAGTDGEPATAAFYQAVGNSPESAAGAVTRVFLGTRIACAQCHDHPFADWKQKDFWGMAAFFGGMGNGNAGVSTAGPGRITYEGVTYAARFLGEDGDAAVSPGDDPRDVLAAWLATPENLDFAATAVNRVWQQLLGRPLVGSVDDLDQATPEERAVVLDPLARRFAESGFDMRWLVAGICKSRVYRCRSTADPGAADSALASVRPLKTLTPEQLFDSLEQALMLPRSRSDEDAARHNGLRTQLVSRFDESAARSPDEYAAGVPQVLLLMNGRLTAEATDLESSRTLRAVVDAPFLEPAQKLDALFLSTLTRLPNDRERGLLLSHLARDSKKTNQKQPYAEVFWALLNSPEFVLCR